MQLNPHYAELNESYLFSTIAHKVADYQKANPDADIIRLGIGDVTLPLAASVTEAMHKAVEEQGHKGTFHGYIPSEQGYEFLRSAIQRQIREFFWSRGFVEVETPTLHNVAGGAAARPFITHMNALDCDFYMRIALELYLKRMLVGGFDRVFEMGRVFRNEGLDRRHNPEFTMLEVYQAYTDHNGMMELIRSLIASICEKVLGTTVIKRADGGEIDLGGEWRKATYMDLVREATGAPDWFELSRAEKAKIAAGLGVETDEKKEHHEITDDVYGRLVEPKLIQPTFVLNVPKELCPLAKINREDGRVLDVFELCINGQEIAPAYSEQNDPLIQREMFEAQVGEERQKLDEDFLTALEYGMPPAGGMGIGIDRLVILLTGAANIRDTILFPSLKPE